MPDDRPDDEGVSSEDLLKEAKSQFGLADGSSGIEDSDLGSSLDSDSSLTAEEMAAELMAADEVPAEPLDSPEPLERDFLRGSDELIADTEGPEAPADRESPSPSFTPDEFEPDSFRVAIPDPGVPTGLPGDMVEVDSDEMLAGLPAPPETTAPAGNLLSTLWRNRWIVVVAVVGVTILAGLLDNSEPISDTVPGDCFDNPSSDEVSEIDPIDCAEDHELEVFATVRLSGADYPGDFAIAEQAFNSCIELFEGYVNEPYATSSLYAFPFTPTEGSWDDGDRNALCVVYEPVPGTNGEEIMSRTGSVRGSGL